MLHNVPDYRYFWFFLLKYATILNLIDPLFSKMEKSMQPKKIELAYSHFANCLRAVVCKI